MARFMSYGARNNRICCRQRSALVTARSILEHRKWQPVACIKVVAFHDLQPSNTIPNLSMNWTPTIAQNERIGGLVDEKILFRKDII